MAALAKIQRRLEHPVVAGIAIAGVGTLSYFLIRALQHVGSRGLPAGVAPPKSRGVPFAEIRGDLVWPVVTSSRVGEVAYTDAQGGTHGNWARRFGAPRDDHTHAGVDLYGTNGDTIVAIADGTVVATQTFHLGTSAILIQHDGAVVNYGEVDPGSWKDFGVGVGSRVRAGQPIASVGCMQGSGSHCSSHMLHLETYRNGTTQNERWIHNPPEDLLDPTMLLLLAAPPGANR